jgi:arylsulfatase A-like enzyme
MTFKPLGVYALATLVIASLLGCRAQAPPPRGNTASPNVVLILVDALRMDHLHLYGYGRRTSDRLDILGSSGWVFENHIASASQTVPSTLSLMLSLHPAEHGFVHTGPGHFSTKSPLYPDTFLFLAEVFQQAQYATGGFVGNPFLDRKNGFHQGFDRFVNSRQDGKLTHSALRWLRQNREVQEPRPFFLYLHYMGVHSPYEPPKTYRRFDVPEGGRLVYKNGLHDNVENRDLAFTQSMYDGGIAFVAAQIAAVLAELDSLGLREDTIVVVTSDHGDEFLEHGGLGHGTHVYGELIRVPLIVSYPKELQPGRRIEHLTRHLDLAPTLLELTGIERPTSYRGHSLRQPARHAFAENGPWRAALSEEGKLVINRDTGEAALFAPTDVFDLFPLQTEPKDSPLWADLESYRLLKKHTQNIAPSTSDHEEWLKEELEHLRTLGYIAK